MCQFWCWAIGKITPPYIRSGGEGFGRVFGAAADFFGEIFSDAGLRSA
jgi:hypothetical protein